MYVVVSFPQEKNEIEEAVTALDSHFLHVQNLSPQPDCITGRLLSVNQTERQKKEEWEERGKTLTPDLPFLCSPS